MTTWYNRFVVWHATSSIALTYVCASEGKQSPEYLLRQQLRGNRDAPVGYPPDWFSIFLKRFNPATESLLLSEPISEEQYLDIAKRAPKLVIEGEFIVHDLSHLRGNYGDDDFDDAAERGN